MKGGSIYRAWDLAIASMLPVPGGVEEAPAGSPDIRVDWGAVPPVPCGLGTPPYALTDRGLVVAVPGVARFRCRPDAVRVDPDPRAGEGMVEALLVATALPASLWMRGDLLLHAAAVEVGAHAVGFMALSGGGKSTLAEALARRGHRVVADDTMRVFPHNGGMAVAGLPACLFRHDGARRIPWTVPPESRMRSAPLNRLVELVADVEEPVDAVHGLGALAALLRHRHRPRIPRLLGLEPGLLPRSAGLARTVRVSRWPIGQALRLTDALAGSGA